MTATLRAPKADAISTDDIAHEIRCMSPANFARDRREGQPVCQCLSCKCHASLNWVPTTSVCSNPGPDPASDPQNDGFYVNDRGPFGVGAMPRPRRLCGAYVCRECGFSESCAAGRCRRKRSNLGKLDERKVAACE